MNRFLYKILLCCGSITSQSFPDFLNLSESCREKVIFVQRHNTSLHSKFCQTALKLTQKGLDYTQIGTWREPCITDLWFWEVLGQSQKWLRTMQTDLWKLYTTISASLNSRPPVQKSKSCACAKTWLCSFKILTVFALACMHMGKSIKFGQNSFILWYIHVKNRPSDITRWCDFAQSTSNHIRSHNSQKIA